MAKRNEKGSVFLVAALAAVIVLLSAQVRPAVAVVDGGYNSTIEAIVNAEVAKVRALAAGLIRLAFHDCFVRGCDGSVLLDSTPYNTSSVTTNPTLAGKTEKVSPSNGGLRGLEVVEIIRTKLKEQNIIVSCADAVQFAAREAAKVVSNGKIAYPINGPGRRDGVKSSSEDPGTFLPGPTFTFSQLSTVFGNKGLSEPELVALSGAHCIGVTNGASFRDRVFAPTSEINSSYQRVITDEWTPNPNGTFIMNIRDMGNYAVKKSRYTPNQVNMAAIGTLDNSFYNANLQNMVRFKSDWELRTNTPANDLMVKYMTTPGLWEADFSAAMTKLSSLVIADTEGPIWEEGSRVKCTATNLMSYPATTP